MRSVQDPDECLHIMNSCRDRLNACDPPEGPTERQYEDIILQALPPEYKAIRRSHWERENIDLADIRGMMAAIYADNLNVHDLIHSGVLRDVVPPCRHWSAIAMTSSVTFFIVSATSKVKAPLRCKHQKRNDGQPPQQC